MDDIDTTSFKGPNTHDYITAFVKKAIQEEKDKVCSVHLKVSGEDRHLYHYNQKIPLAA